MTTNNSNNPNNDSDDLEKIDADITKHRKYALRLIITVFSIFILYFCIKTTFIISHDIDGNWTLPNLSNLTAVDSGDWGTFGDFIGGILNPIFALFAFYWLTYSVRLQIKELKDTRTELKKAADAQVEATKHQENIARLEDENVKTQQEILTLQRTSLDKQIESARLQQRQIAIQNFESLFFQLLRTKDDALNDIIYIKRTRVNKNKQVEDKEKRIPVEYSQEIYKSVDAIKRHIIAFKSQDTKDWLTYYENNMLDFTGSYFRTCYQIVKLIDQNDSLKDINPSSNNNPPSQEQKKYFDIFRATLTKHETEAFFFNCLNEYGNKKFKKLIEKYGLFEPLPIDLNRTNEEIHRLTRYAYKFDSIIFEENKLWLKYFKDLEKIRINIQEHEILDILNKLLNLDIIKPNILLSSYNIINNLDTLSGNSYILNINKNYEDISYLISDEHISDIEKSSESTFYENKINEENSLDKIRHYEIKKNEIIDIFTLNNTPIDINKLLLPKENGKEYYSIAILEDYIHNENINLDVTAGYFTNYSSNKNVIQNSEYTLTALLLVKYGIDYTEYCDYINSGQTIDNPPQQS
ncbi:putative phage abortive infection protein [uncultured Acinetobacter sp.]|uniref:putative phage abortive infection protein n=1 Tax=uncultured Acinetobacter sp. TaxID=165433 RepID=UPI0025877BA7|nr:putative phage abortive infection protein [uncultured Acinetobacter sp.]